MPDRTTTPVRTPTRTVPETPIDPAPCYSPDRLCPSQRDDAEHDARP